MIVAVAFDILLKVFIITTIGIQQCAVKPHSSISVVNDPRDLHGWQVFVDTRISIACFSCFRNEALLRKSVSHTGLVMRQVPWKGPCIIYLHLDVR